MKVRVPDVDPGRCDSRNILEVIMEVNLIKDLHKIGMKSSILNLLNQFTTCSEVLLTSRRFHQLMVRSENVSGKHQYLLSKDIKYAIAKHRVEIIFIPA